MVVKIMNMKSEILSDNLHNEKEFDNPNIYSDLGRNAHKFSINSCKKFAISYICMFLVAIICIVSTILALLFTNSFYVIKYIDSGHNTIYQVQFLSNLTIYLVCITYPIIFGVTLGFISAVLYVLLNELRFKYAQLENMHTLFGFF